MALLGLLLDQSNASNVCRLAEATTIGLLDVCFIFRIAFATNHFTTTDMNRSNFRKIANGTKAGGALEGVVIGIEDALERMRRSGGLGIRRHGPTTKTQRPVSSKIRTRPLSLSIDTT